MGKRLVCITGGYGRLGKALATEFKGNGDQVLITEPDEPNATTAADQPCTVTLFADHELAKQWGCDNADDALHAAKFYVSEYYHTS